MALRQTTGFAESLLQLIGLDWDVPDFSTLSRRQKTLAVNIPFRGSQGPLHLLIDSTGIKVEGEGEWNARKHGGQKRPSPRFLGPVAKPWLDWRKIHIGIDEQTLEVRAVEVTSSDIGDVEPVSAIGSSEPARNAAGTSRPDPARPRDRQRHC
jgi:Transposase DDE domain